MLDRRTGGEGHGLRRSDASSSSRAQVPAETGRISEDGEINFDGLPDVIRELAERNVSPAGNNVARFERTAQGILTTPRSLMSSDHALYFKLDGLLCLDPDDYELEELRLVLQEVYEAGNFTTTDQGLFRKALCHYDRLRYLRS